MSLHEGEQDHYRVLGLSHMCSQDDVKKAFQSMAKEYHPDVSPSPGAAAQFARAKEAYDALRSDASRSQYDARLRSRSGGMDAYERERLHQRAAAFKQSYQSAGMQRGVVRVAEAFIRPRTLVMLPFLALASWYLTTYVSGPGVPRDATASSLAGAGVQAYGSEAHDKIRAWWNPATQRWETPAPWDPAFRAVAHTVTLQPRARVHMSEPPQQQSHERGMALR